MTITNKSFLKDPIKGQKPMDRLHELILSMVEIDQDLATLQEYYRAGSKEKVTKRFQEVMGALSREIEMIRLLSPDSYINEEDK